MTYSHLTIKCLVAVTVVLFGASAESIAQEPDNPLLGAEPKGNVSSVTLKRTYFVFEGKLIANPKTEILSTDRYDSKQRLIQTSVFSAGEERTTYEWAGERPTTTVAYYDLNGNLNLSLSKTFVRKFGGPPETDLCPGFVTRTEKDGNQHLERIIETCVDNTYRRTEVYEYTSEGQIARLSVNDAKGRRWEYVTRFGLNYLFLGFKFSANDGLRPPYTQDVDYSNVHLDQARNVVSRTAKVTDSRVPGRVVYEYLEQLEYTYREP